jgi:hypothetical protein
MSLGMMASQAVARTVPEGAQVQKWKVFHSIREARDLIGATDRSLAILNALLSFHPETELAGDGELIVCQMLEGPCQGLLQGVFGLAVAVSPFNIYRHVADGSNAWLIAIALFVGLGRIPLFGDNDLIVIVQVIGRSGLELAGELKAKWPDKKVTIVDRNPDIVTGDYPDEFRAELRRQLDEFGVELRVTARMRASSSRGLKGLVR